jgi:hypothetical protein
VFLDAIVTDSVFQCPDEDIRTTGVVAGLDG